MTRRLLHVLLLGLAMFAVETAYLAHEHDTGAAPAGSSAQGCTLCVGHSAAAPAPDAHAPPKPDFRLAASIGTRTDAARPSRSHGAHRSRAPPEFRPV